MKEFQHKYNDDKKSSKKDIHNINLNRLPVIIILDGLTDVGNVGMIFRLADALRLKKVYFYNYSKKIDSKLLNKKSRSTLKYVSYEYLDNIKNILELKQKYKMIVLDKTNISTSYIKNEYLTPVCLIIGAERTGVSQELIDLSDLSIHLPMQGINSSINVATASSVVLYDIYNKINNK